MDMSEVMLSQYPVTSPVVMAVKRLELTDAKVPQNPFRVLILFPHGNNFNRFVSIRIIYILRINSL